MPLIQVSILEGRTMEKKKELIRELTRTAAEVLEAPPDRVRVVITEVPKDHWGIGGVAVSDLPGR